MPIASLALEIRTLGGSNRRSLFGVTTGMRVPRRRLVVIAAGAAAVMVAGLVTAFAVWSSRQAPRVAFHPAASSSPTPGASLDAGNPFGVIPNSPSAQPTSSEAPTSPTVATSPTADSLPLPTSSTPSANAAMLGSDAEGRPTLASLELWPGRPMTAMTTTWKWYGSQWIAIHSDPQIEIGGKLVYDPYLRKIVELGGGITGIPYSTWGWDGRAWADLQPSTVPTTGIDVALVVLDPARQQLVALVPESQTVSSTWTFDGRAWTRAATAISPPPRRRAGIAYDPVSSKVVLYGGDGQGAAGALDDTWTWDGKTWTRLHPTTTPGGGQAQLVYDAASSQMILFCQRQQAPGSRNYTVTTWSWTGSTWTQLHPNTMPPAAGSPAMTYDAVGRELVLFETPVISPGPSQTWTYANGEWKQAS